MDVLVIYVIWQYRRGMYLSFMLFGSIYWEIYLSSILFGSIDGEMHVSLLHVAKPMYSLCGQFGGKNGEIFLLSE